MDYNRVAKNVAKKLAQYGQSVTLRQFSSGSSDYDPSTQQASLPVSVDSIRKALITDQPGTRIGPQYGTNLKEGSLIQDVEKWLYVDALGPAPKNQDQIILNGVPFSVIDVQVTGPGGVPLFYLVVLRT